jgi:hypothetical protein
MHHFPSVIALVTEGNTMIVVRTALFVVAIFATSATAGQMTPNSAEWPIGEGWALRPQATHDWETPDPALPDAVTPMMTIRIPTEFKLDVELTIRRIDTPSEKGGAHLQRQKAIASEGACARHDVRLRHCRRGLRSPQARR